MTRKPTRCRPSRFVFIHSRIAKCALSVAREKNGRFTNFRLPAVCIAIKNPRYDGLRIRSPSPVSLRTGELVMIHRLLATASLPGIVVVLAGSNIR